jgi:DNA-binding NarL/FixJ family response regulator
MVPLPAASLSKCDNLGPIRVLVTDNTAMGAELLARTLNRDRRFQILETVCTPDEIQRAAAEHHPDVVILTHLDEDSPARFRTARELRASFPNIRLVIILDSPRRQLVVEAFRAGAKGILSRSGSIKLLGKCLECVHRGQIWATFAEVQYLIDALFESPPLRLADSKGVPLLSKQEQAVVYWMTEGLSNREIAAQLKLSEHTVKNYIFRIFDKLGVSKRVEVILYALSRREEAQEANISQLEDTSIEDRLLFQWSRALAEQGSAMAGFMLGQMYRDGKGTKQDYVSAYAWFHFAKFGPEELRGASTLACQRLSRKMTQEEISTALLRVVEVLESKSNPQQQSKSSHLLRASATHGSPEYPEADPVVVKAD